MRGEGYRLGRVSWHPFASATTEARLRAISRFGTEAKQPLAGQNAQINSTMRIEQVLVM